MRVREVVESLAVQAYGALDDSTSRLAVTPTQDHPTIFNHKRVDAQWVLLGRSDSERQRIRPLRNRESAVDNRAPEPQPQLSSANVALRVDIGGFEVAVRIHLHAAIDRHNLRAKLKIEEHKASLLTLLQSLPETAVLTLDADVRNASSSDTDTLETLTTALSGGPTWISVGFAWGRDHDAVTEPAFADEVANCVAALLPIYDFIAWTTDNDFIDGQSFIEEESTRQAEKSDGEDPPQPAAQPETQPSPSTKSRPSTRGGWSYRPDWQFDPTPSATTAAPRSPSSRVRERAAELQREARDWNYSGPSREQRPHNSRQEGRPERDRDRSSRSERDRNQRGSDRGNRRPSDRGGPPRGGSGRPRRSQNERGDQRGAGGRRNNKRDTQRGPSTTRGRKSVDKMQWVDAQGDINAQDYVRITDGLFSGKVAQVADRTKKGFRVVLGDGGMTVEVAEAGVTKIEEKS